jgi:hypothetical protein
MKHALAMGLVLSLSAGSTYAQESLVGKYSGGFMGMTSSGEQLVTLQLHIQSVDNGKVKAKAVRGAIGTKGPGYSCAGEYQMEGSYTGNKLVLKPVSGPGAGDCRLGFVPVAEGNKLKGRVNKNKVELSK